MPYVIVENFNAGLDRRRAQVAGAPGSLWDLTNAHITRGGEIEKRKAFVDTYDLPAGKTFGMQQASNQIYTFGSVAASSISVPMGVNYQQLVHPDGAAMTAVVASEVYNGKTYVVAKFSDGTIHHYYNAARVTDWDNGVVRAAQNTNTLLATFLNSLFPGDNSSFSASATGAVVTITGPVNEAFTFASSLIAVASNGQTLALAQTQASDATHPQIITATFSGTWGTGDQFNVGLTLSGATSATNYGYLGNPSPVGTTLLTFKSKMYSTASSLLDFSALNDATRWNVSQTGAGFQDMSTQDAGSDTLTAINSFLGNMVIFSRKTTQIWFIDPNPTNNSLLQVLRNLGTRAPKSVVPFGNNDMFYLDEPGVRSLRAFFATSLAMLTDIGTPIDTIIQAQIKSLTAVQVEAAAAVIEPIDRRYMIAIGNSVYVFSYFQSAKINAWSEYDVGFQITDWAIIDNQLYARAGDTIYLYGGANGSTYDTGPSDAYTVNVTLPYLTASKPATMKKVIGFDAALTGTWDAYLLTDPASAAVSQKIGTISSTTYLNPMDATDIETTHFAPQFVCSTPGPATIANMAILYTDGESPDPLGPSR